MADLDVLTLAEAKAALNVAGVTTHDTELPAWVTATSVLLDHKVGPIVKRTVTGEIHDGNATEIMTELYPVVSFTTVTEYADTTGTVLTRETNVLKPDSAYLAEAYGPNPALFSGRLRRRGGGSDTPFSAGQGNVEITYVAGRFDNTAAVDERFKAAAKLTLSYLWASQRPSLAQVGDFEVPTQNWPKFDVPNAVRMMLSDEWHAPLMVGA